MNPAVQTNPPEPPNGNASNVVPFRRRSDEGAHVEPEAGAMAADETAAMQAEQASAERGRHRRKTWLREVRIIAYSYLLNGACLGLFSLAGSVHWSAGLAYAGPGLAVEALAAWLIATRRSERFKDPSLAMLHSGGSLVLCVLGMVFFPQLSFIYALFLFAVFLTATYRLTKAQITTAWAVSCLLVGVVTLTPGQMLHIPHEKPLEQFATWLVFTVMLGRCVLLSVINMLNTQLLKQRGKQMAETLAKIDRLAKYDELTGVLNRRSLLHIVGDERARTDRGSSPTSVAIFDLDHFKMLNDTFGHLAGDRALRLFAQEVQQLTRTTDRFGRYGGEEFLMVLTDTDLDKAEIAVERIRSGLAKVDWAAIAPGIGVTFSAGIASYRPGESTEQLLARADLGLYGAKHAGRNCTRAG